jgi:hypothetical protein
MRASSSRKGPVGDAGESSARGSSAQLVPRPELEAALQTGTHPGRVVDDLFGAAARAYHRLACSRDRATVRRTDLVNRIFVGISLKLHLRLALDSPTSCYKVRLPGVRPPGTEKRRPSRPAGYRGSQVRPSVLTRRACCSSVTHSTFRYSIISFFFIPILFASSIVNLYAGTSIGLSTYSNSS